MRVSVAHHEVEPMIVASSESCLQTVVSRPIEIREVINEAEVRELGGKGQRSRCKIGLIEINDTGKFDCMVTHVSDVETKLAGKGMLNAQRPVLYVGSTKVSVHGKSIAGTGICRSAA